MYFYDQLYTSPISIMSSPIASLLLDVSQITTKDSLYSLTYDVLSN